MKPTKQPNYLEGLTVSVNHDDLILPKITTKPIETFEPPKEDVAKVTHTLFISGKVKDVQAQLAIMCKQFPNMTIREMLDKYGLTTMVLQ